MESGSTNRHIGRRSFLSGMGAIATAGTLPGATAAAALGTASPCFVSVNLQGLEGGSKVPGMAGRDYFVPSPADLADVAPRTTGPFRLPFLWERLQPTIAGPLETIYLGQIKSVADAAAAIGRTIVLDCHNFMHRQVGGADRYVDGTDGVLTRAHLADLWFKIASALGTHPGIAGWDIMNEPQGAHGPLAPIMRAVVAAIDAVETRKMVYIEGSSYSSAARWVADNPEYPVTDAHDRIVYSAHCYADFDASGTHFDYASQLAHNIPDTVLVDRSTDFLQWCRAHGLRGHIGETNVGIDDPRWLSVLENGLAFWKENNLPVHLWLYASHFGPNPFNLFDHPGSQAPRWDVIRRFVGPTQPARPLLSVAER